MENLSDYEDQELLEEMNVAAWAAVVHHGALRAKAWARFKALTVVLQERFPVDAASPSAAED